MNRQHVRIAVGVVVASLAIYSLAIGAQVRTLPLMRQPAVNTIEASPDGEAFRVQVDRGALGVTVVFEQGVKVAPDGSQDADGIYRPRVTWSYDGPTTEPSSEVVDWSLIERYKTPWNVYAEIDYGHLVPDANGGHAIVVDSTVTTNKLEVKSR